MSKSLEELKAIRDGAPKDGTATHIDGDGDYAKYGGMYNYFYSKDLREWVSADIVNMDRSLSDINRIIELEEWKIEANLNHQNMLNAYLND